MSNPLHIDFASSPRNVDMPLDRTSGEVVTRHIDDLPESDQRRIRKWMSEVKAEKKTIIDICRSKDGTYRGWSR
jgi:hypothetical protein